MYTMSWFEHGRYRSTQSDEYSTLVILYEAILGGARVMGLEIRRGTRVLRREGA